MGRAEGVPHAAGGGGDIRRRGGDEARVIERFKRLGPQRQALALAVRPFADDDGRMDAMRWEEAFTSGDPATIVEVVAAKGLYEALLNHVVEMLQAGARLAGLDVARGEEKPPAPPLINAVKDDGGLTANQAELLLKLSRLRNELQHASPGVQADQAREGIEVLYKTLPGIARGYVAWLERYDVQLLPKREQP
jgi:hypothetical protein